MLKGLLKHLGKAEPAPKKLAPVIIPRNKHTISRSGISPNALKVLYRLNGAGYSAYLVGGCVRDLLLGKQPKDFDIATNALPDEVRRLFRNCRLIGKRFRLAHIIFGKEIIEVATFRTHHQNAGEAHGKHSHEGMILRDNVFGAIEDDVLRRDFTINALYYNIADFSIVDYVGGMDDVQKKLLRVIGNPEQRFQEDPVRMLRAIRFMGKLNIEMSPETEHSVTHLSHLVEQVSPARLFQEILKLFHEGATARTFHLLQKYHLFAALFPQTSACLQQPQTKNLLEISLQNTDERTRDGKTVSPAFLLAVFMWRPVLQQMLSEKDKGLPPYVGMEHALQDVLKKQTEKLAIPRALLTTIREICFLQHHFTQRFGSRPHRTITHPRFRAAYDLLLLRAKAGEPVEDVAQWWTKFHDADPEQREQLLKEAKRTHPGKKKKFRKKTKMKKTPSQAGE